MDALGAKTQSALGIRRRCHGMLQGKAKGKKPKETQANGKL
jgi:hypothetical protein